MKVVIIAVVPILSCWIWFGLMNYCLFPPPPPPTDLLVRNVSNEFQYHIQTGQQLKITNVGALQHTRKTLFWNNFEAKFGSNPNTPYMYNTLPLFSKLFPLLSPMWNIYDHKDAVVLISKIPPPSQYFSFTFFALWIADMGRKGLPFASLGDSLNSYNINYDTNTNLFAYIVTSNKHTANLVEESLIMSGLPKSAINVVPIPTDLAPLGGVAKGGTYFEVVLRLFKFHNQTLGEEYLASFPPVFYIQGQYHDDDTDGEESNLLPTSYYKDRYHPDSINENILVDNYNEFEDFGNQIVSKICQQVFRRECLASNRSQRYITFNPLIIRGLDCLRQKQDCLGDCPDAAYFGPNIDEAINEIELLKLLYNQIHIMTLVNHKAVNTSVYSSVAIIAPPNPLKTSKLSKSHMSIRATPIGITSFDFDSNGSENQGNAPTSSANIMTKVFVSWVFTRNPIHCERLMELDSTIDGCTVVQAKDVPLDGYMTYCERVYLNPTTGLGPDWNSILPARLYTIDFQQTSTPTTVISDKNQSSSSLFRKMTFPEPIPVKVYHHEPFRMLHIIKTGGESLQNYLDTAVSPKYSFQTCRRAATTARNNSGNASNTTSSACLAGASIVSSALCGLNCECCAKDIRLSEGGFHGTLIRSPRSHALSLFSHGHVAHHTTIRRIIADVPLYLAEGLLRMTEKACGSYCTGSNADWKIALKDRLLGIDPSANIESNRPLRVLPLENTQSHALTCSISNGSFGHHFRVTGIDALEPDVNDAIATLRGMEFVGITDLMESSICLLHYQSNGTLPSVCDCNSPRRWDPNYWPLGYWKEYRYKSRSVQSLSSDLLEKLDEHTDVDRKVFVEAVRLLLGRLRHVELVTGSDILSCIHWNKFHKATEYMTELWEEGLLSNVGL